MNSRGHGTNMFVGTIKSSVVPAWASAAPFTAPPAPGVVPDGASNTFRPVRFLPGARARAGTAAGIRDHPRHDDAPRKPPASCAVAAAVAARAMRDDRRGVHDRRDTASRVAAMRADRRGVPAGGWSARSGPAVLLAGAVGRSWPASEDDARSARAAAARVTRMEVGLVMVVIGGPQPVDSASAAPQAESESGLICTASEA